MDDRVINVTGHSLSRRPRRWVAFDPAATTSMLAISGVVLAASLLLTSLTVLGGTAAPGSAESALEPVPGLGAAAPAPAPAPPPEADPCRITC